MYVREEEDYWYKVIEKILSLLKYWLVVKERDGIWKRLNPADFFTEFDVQMNKLKYVHDGNLGSKSQVSLTHNSIDLLFSSINQLLGFIFISSQWRKIKQP